jgi:cell division protein FtsB
MPAQKRDTRLLFTIVVVLALLFVLTYAGRLARKTRLEVELARWETKIEQAKNHQYELQKELRYVQSDAYIEKLAHDEFGMVKSGEELVVIVPVDPLAALTPTTAPEAAVVEPFWQKLLGRLGLRD